MALRRARVRVVRTSVLAVAVILTLIWWWPRSVLPPLDGRIPLAGLERPVEVRFDAFGIPHISARSDGDAWMAVGYLQGRDRLWQMELYRRAASGRLAELLGENLVAIDQRFLTLGLRRAAELEWARAAPDVRQAVERYTAGVNAAMAADGRWKLPLELQLLRVQPSPWSPVDSLAIGKLFAWRLGENHAAELLRYALAQELGPRAADLLGPEKGSEKGSGVFFDGTDRKRLPISFPAMPAGLAWLSDDHHAASNSWVISGARTASGRPLLANDPHLTIEMPSVWWEVHVSADAGAAGSALNVTGVTIPGIPFVLIGHNDRIGWGVTNSGADVQDFLRRASRSGAPAISGVARERHVGSAHDDSLRDSREGPARSAAVRRSRNGPRPRDERGRVARAASRQRAALKRAERNGAGAEMGCGATGRVCGRVPRAGAGGRLARVCGRRPRALRAVPEFRVRRRGREYRLRDVRPGARAPVRRRHHPGAGLDERLGVARIHRAGTAARDGEPAQRSNHRRE